MLKRSNPVAPTWSHGAAGLSRLRLHYIMEALCSQVMQEDWSLTTEVAAEKVMLLAPSEVRQLLYAPPPPPPRCGCVRSLVVAERARDLTGAGRTPSRSHSVLNVRDLLAPARQQLCFADLRSCEFPTVSQSPPATVAGTTLTVAADKVWAQLQLRVEVAELEGTPSARLAIGTRPPPSGHHRLLPAPLTETDGPNPGMWHQHHQPT